MCYRDYVGRYISQSYDVSVFISAKGKTFNNGMMTKKMFVRHLLSRQNQNMLAP